MIDTIDRIALMEKLGIEKECTVCEQNSKPYCKWKPDVVDVCEAICTAPTIEPEIIRCKKCRYKKRKGVDYFCDHITGVEIMVSPNDYCSWAERGTDG